MLMLGVEEDVVCFGTRTGVTCNVVVSVIERCPKGMVCKCLMKPSFCTASAINSTSATVVSISTTYMCTGTLIVKFVDWAFSPMLCRHCCKKFPNISATTTCPIPRRTNQKAVDPHDIRNRTFSGTYHMYRKNQVPHTCTRRSHSSPHGKRA